MKTILLVLFLAGNASAQTSIVTDFGITKAVGDGAYVLKAGDVMTGPLQTTTATITGANFSVGGSTLVVKNGNVGIGIAEPYHYGLSILGRGLIRDGNNNFNLHANSYYGPASWGEARNDYYYGSSFAGRIGFLASVDGAWYFETAPSGTANTVPSFTTRMKIGNTGVVTIGGNVGIGNTNPDSKVHISTGGASPALKIDGSFTNGEYIVKISSASEQVWGLHTNGHFSMGGTAPTLGTCANGSIVTGSHDSAGAVSFAGANSSCAIVFGEPYDNVPFCVVSGAVATATEGAIISAISATGFTVVPNTGAWDNGDKVNFICMGAHD